MEYTPLVPGVLALSRVGSKQDLSASPPRTRDRDGRRDTYSVTPFCVWVTITLGVSVFVLSVHVTNDVLSVSSSVQAVSVLV